MPPDDELQAPNVERLLDVATILEGVPDERLYMGAWRFGTCACAVAHYCLARPESGLRLVLERDGFGNGIGFVVRPSNPMDFTDAPGPFGFAAFHFGIGLTQAFYLFDLVAYPKGGATRAAVIDRIRGFVASQGGSSDAVGA